MNIIRLVQLLLLATICNGADKSRFPMQPSKILIWPSQYSHWFIFKILAQSLSSRGHRVTVLRPTCFKPYVKEGEGYELLDYETGGKDISVDLDALNEYILKFSMAIEEVSLFQKLTGLLELFKLSGIKSDACRYILKNKNLIEKLKQEKYDVLLSNPSILGGEILAAKLGIPHISTANVFVADGHFRFAGSPVPLSYVPIFLTGLTDEMSFRQRTVNTIMLLLNDNLVNNYVALNIFQPTIDEYLDPRVKLHDLMKNTSLWLVRTDFAFDYPRPYTPNIKFVGGITARPGKPLTKEFEDIVTASGEAGFIVFSLGSMISSVDISKANMFASAFSKLKQKVIWRYSGERPETLGSNTKLVDWLPQNDLLTHPNCKLFITHGGNSGIYEAIYHGVPMLGFPLFGDQYDNLIRVQDRGGGIILEPSGLKKNKFLSTMQELIYNTSYKENMIELSKRHRDQPMSPLNSAVYWIEYVIRHEGAYHLRPATHKLYWFQYYLLDVIVFLLVICLAVLYLNVKVLGLVWRKCKQIFKTAEKVKKH